MFCSYTVIFYISSRFNDGNSIQYSKKKIRTLWIQVAAWNARKRLQFCQQFMYRLEKKRGIYKQDPYPIPSMYATFTYTLTVDFLW